MTCLRPALAIVSTLVLSSACGSGSKADAGSSESGDESETTSDATTETSTETGDGDGDTGDGDGDGDGDGEAADAQLIAAGSAHSCAVVEGGLRCWGVANLGQLGNVDVDPVGDNELPSGEEFIAVGGSVVAMDLSRHSCAILEGGQLSCWGGANGGPLGYGNGDNIGDDETPESAGAVSVGATVLEVATGNSHTCALVEGGAVRCWGQGFFGRLGYGNVDDIGDDETPDSVGDVSIGGTATAVAAGANHSCALLDDGAVKCWGNALNGQLGLGNTDNIGDDETPDTVGSVALGGTAEAIAVGANHSCALLDDGSVRCWGDNASGQLGLGNTDVLGDDESPDSASAIDLGATATALTAGADFTCALLEGGEVKCWGGNAYGQLGRGDTDVIGDDETPAGSSAIDLGGSAVAIDAGDEHACAILDDGKSRCWGRGEFGRLGYGNTDHIGDDETPASAGDVPL